MGKQAYERPRITVHGDIRDLTQHFRWWYHRHSYTPPPDDSPFS